MEVAFPYRLHGHQHCALDNTVCQGRYTQRTQLAVCFRDIDPFDRLRAIGAHQKVGLQVIQDRPVVRDGEIVVRPMMYIALTYDHRIVDGREAVTFLKRVKTGIEDPARILLEV